MRRRVIATLGLSAVIPIALCHTALGQGWPPWSDDLFGRSWDYDRRDRWESRRAPRAEEEDGPRTRGGDLRDGGPRPEIAAKAPAIVEFRHDFPASSIVIDTGARRLYYVLPDHRAYQYAISVGREGFNWTGTETVSRKQAWPDWHPPKEMRERDTSLPEKMTGGMKNPLGAMALYLGDTLYRIHGTNDVKSIGHAQSSGCFRLINSEVLHLASITEIGATVTVVPKLPERQEISRAPELLPSNRIQREPDAATQPKPRGSYDDQSRSAPDYRALRDQVLRR